MNSTSSGRTPSRARSKSLSRAAAMSRLDSTIRYRRRAVRRRSCELQRRRIVRRRPRNRWSGRSISRLRAHQPPGNQRATKLRSRAGSNACESRLASGNTEAVVWAEVKRRYRSARCNGAASSATQPMDRNDCTMSGRMLASFAAQTHEAGVAADLPMSQTMKPKTFEVSSFARPHDGQFVEVS